MRKRRRLVSIIIWAPQPSAATRSLFTATFHAHALPVLDWPVGCTFIIGPSDLNQPTNLQHHEQVSAGLPRRVFSVTSIQQQESNRGSARPFHATWKNIPRSCKLDLLLIALMMPSVHIADLFPGPKVFVTFRHFGSTFLFPRGCPFEMALLYRLGS